MLLLVIDDNNSIVTISDNFIYFWACNTTHASSNTFSSPSSRTNDGYIYISYITDNVSRFDLIKIMLKLSSGALFNIQKFII